MSTSAFPFSILEHELPCSHIREYPLATANTQEDVLYLAIKQYIPKDNKHPQPGDVTIIGAHANGFPKELYEPLWEELYQRLKQNNIRIRSIWITDVAHQGQSSVLNEDKLGNDPSWWDHARDLFLMVNHFRDQMTRPLVGVGHSMGGFHITNLALLHARLFTSVILIDPVIQRIISSEGNYLPAAASARRRDLWPSREAARMAFAKSKFYQTWDPRVLELWIQHGLRDLPTQLYPSANDKSNITSTITSTSKTGCPVTLKTTKHQEVLTFMRANFESEANPAPTSKPNPLTHPDVDTALHPISPFYRPEAQILFTRLPFLRPSALYIFGTNSNLSKPALRADKVAVTGVGVGGSGGSKAGRVKHVVLDAGHLIPMEKVVETAQSCADWISSELSRWREDESVVGEMRRAVPSDKKALMSEDFIRHVDEEFSSGVKKPKL